MSTDDKSIQFYKNNAKEYAAHVRNSQESVYHAYYEKPAMYALLPDLAGKIVLSIGCGSGEDSEYLRKQGAERSVGIDLIEELIEIAKDSYPECEFRVMDMQNLKFRDNAFDFVYSSLAIHYVEDWEKVFKEVYRVLKPNSCFLFSCGHPLMFAMEKTKNKNFLTKKLELVKNMQTGKMKVTGDYFSKRKVIDALGENTVNTWTMSMSDIVKSATKAGFLIEKLEEPHPLDELKELDPASYEKLSRLPEFVIFKLIKLN